MLHCRRRTPQREEISSERTWYCSHIVCPVEDRARVCASRIVESWRQAQKKVRALAPAARHKLISREVRGSDVSEGEYNGSLAAIRPHLTSDSTRRLTSAFAEDENVKALVNRGVRCSPLGEDRKYNLAHENQSRRTSGRRRWFLG